MAFHSTQGATVRGSDLEETEGLAHRRLDVKQLDIPPVLLPERHKGVGAWRMSMSMRG
jgi:hypothetical protein